MSIVFWISDLSSAPTPYIESVTRFLHSYACLQYPQAIAFVFELTQPLPQDFNQTLPVHACVRPIVSQADLDYVKNQLDHSMCLVGEFCGIHNEWTWPEL